MIIFFDSEHKLRAVWKILLTFVFFYALLFILTIVFTSCYLIFKVILGNGININKITDQISGDNFYNFCTYIIQALSMILPVILFWKVFEKKPIRDLGLTIPIKHFKDLLKGLLLGGGCITVIFIVLYLSGQITLVNSWFSPNISWMLVNDLIIMFLVALNEELFARGYCMGVLAESTSNRFIIYIVPAIIFSAMHSMNPNINIIGFVNIFIIGLFLGYMFRTTGNLWMPIGYHMAWNFFQGSVFSFPVSGLYFQGIFSIQLNETNIFNGGAFGPEGGLITTIIIIITMAVMVKSNKTLKNKMYVNQ